MKVKLTDITPGKNYSRTFGVGDVRSLAESMQENGQITPVTINSQNVLVCGFRRFAAANELGWHEIDCIVDDRDPKILNLIENLQRENPSLWEEIQGIRDAFGENPVKADIRRALSKSKSWVFPRVEVWNLPSDFIDKVRTGQSGLREINKMLADKRGPSPVSLNLGIPSQPDIKRMVSHLMSEGRDVEARALSFACGSISENDLRNDPPSQEL